MRARPLGSEGKRKGRRWGAGETLTLQQRKTSLENSGPRERQGLKCKRSTRGRSRTGSGPSVLMRGGDGQTDALSSTPRGTAQITHLETGAGDTEKETRRKEGEKG